MIMKIKPKKCANKECGIMFIPKRTTIEKVCSYQCASAYAKQLREKKEKKEWDRRKRKMQDNVKTKKDYEKELQKIFNEFIRLRDRNKPCISCDAAPNTYTINAGHYFPSGSYKNLRFNEDNVHNQCVHCNQHKHGNIVEYSLNLRERIGVDRFNALQDARNISRHYSIPELIEMKVIYKDKVRKLKNSN